MTITTITLIIGIFRTLVVVLEILIVVATLAINAFVGIWNFAGPVHKLQQTIKDGESFILKYTEAIKAFTDQLLNILGVVMTLFNLIPKIIAVLNALLITITGFIELIAKLFSDYIGGCISEGEIVTKNSDNTYTIDPSKLQNFLDSNLDNGNNLNIPGMPGRYGDYIHDDSEKQHRIYRPKIN
jgi:phage-related protein